MEKTVEKALINAIKNNGGWCIKLLATHVTGLPDRLCLLPKGNIFFAELKAENKKPRKIQLAVHKKLVNLGFEVFVIDTAEQARKLVENYIELYNVK